MQISCQRKQNRVKALSRFGSLIPIQESGTAIAWIFSQVFPQYILFAGWYIGGGTRTKPPAPGHLDDRPGRPLALGFSIAASASLRCIRLPNQSSSSAGRAGRPRWRREPRFLRSEFRPGGVRPFSRGTPRAAPPHPAAHPRSSGPAPAAWHPADRISSRPASRSGSSPLWTLAPDHAVRARPRSQVASSACCRRLKRARRGFERQPASVLLQDPVCGAGGAARARRP